MRMVLHENILHENLADKKEANYMYSGIAVGTNG